ncbi:hypothetical protein IAU60_000497 [Kwoniella sp. DSM 27419]
MSHSPSSLSDLVSAFDSQLKLERTPVHPFHREGDIGLATTDGLVLMASCARLARASTVFADMVEMARPAAIQEQDSHSRPSSSGPATGEARPLSEIQTLQVVDVGFSSKTTDHFLSLINVIKPSIPLIDFDGALDLLDLCDKYDVLPRLQGLIKDALMMRVKGRQWRLLVWAGRRDDVDMAREALCRMTTKRFMAYGRVARAATTVAGIAETPEKRTPVEAASKGAAGEGEDDKQVETERQSVQPDTLPWHAISKLPAHWQVELLRCVLTPSTRGSKQALWDASVFEVTRRWHDVARAFHPSTGYESLARDSSARTVDSRRAIVPLKQHEASKADCSPGFAPD